jgi:DNA (cytosine-5)-methyltransferase 1
MATKKGAVQEPLVPSEVLIEHLGITSKRLAELEKRGVVNYRMIESQKHYSVTALKHYLNPPKNPDHIVPGVARLGKLVVAELFCGAGGLALGLSRAGLNTTLATDWDKDCIETITRNAPEWNPQQADVTMLNLKQLKGTVDVLTGGFPCQAFSYAGNRLGFGDIRGTLFYEYARLVKQVRPRILVAENVRGLLQHDSGRTLQTMAEALRALGYRIAYRVLRSQFLDVPQKRERLIILGIRKDVGSEVYFPIEKLSVATLRGALRDVPPSAGATYPPEKRRVMALIPPGGNWRDLPLGEQKKYMKASFHLGGGKTGLARRLSLDEPSLTLTTAPAQNQTERCHPIETRPLSVREYARIQTFPDNWEFAGSTASQYRQIGNAVPVNLGFHIGIAIRRTLGERPINPTIVTELEKVAAD